MNFTIPATSIAIIKIVVFTIAVCAIILCSGLAVCLLLGVKPDPIVFTAYGTITGQVVGSITSMLSNTRSTPGSDADMPKGTITTDKDKQPATSDKPTL